MSLQFINKAKQQVGENPCDLSAALGNNSSLAGSLLTLCGNSRHSACTCDYRLIYSKLNGGSVQRGLQDNHYTVSAVLGYDIKLGMRSFEFHMKSIKEHFTATAASNISSECCHFSSDLFSFGESQPCGHDLCPQGLQSLKSKVVSVNIKYRLGTTHFDSS